MVGTDILSPEKLTKDGNPAVVVQTESWYNTYGTQFFAVDQVNGTIYAIKDNGQWELTKEKATIDANTHNIIMSTTPIAGSKMTSQGVSIDVTPGNRIEQSLPLAESTRTPGHQDQNLKRLESLVSRKAWQVEREQIANTLMHELFEEDMQEEQSSIIQELQAAEEARQRALKDAEILKEQLLLIEAQQKAEQEKEDQILKEQEEARQKLLQEEEAKLS